MSVLPKGSKVLVTGASGYIGSILADQLLAAGYTVRGTSRSKSSAQWVVDYLDSRHGKGKIEIFEVTDMTKETAYDEAVKGVSGIVHLSTVGSATEGFDSDPNKVIPPVVAATTNILSSAKKEPGIKAVVLTSSAAAVVAAELDKHATITEDTWNEAAVHKSWNDPNVDGFTVYSASKTEGEKRFWQKAKDDAVTFQVVTVLPSANFGPIIKPNGEFSSSTGTWVPFIYYGKTEMLYNVPPSSYVHVVDTAKLHVIALTDPTANGRRLFAYGPKFRWTEILEYMHKARPDHKLPDPPATEGHDLYKYPTEFAESLLKKHYGHGFTSLEQGVKDGIANLK